MSGDTIFVFCLIGLVAVLMASNRVRYDMVALIVVIALMLSGIQSAGQALSGFGSPVVILVAALLVVGEMLDRTGVAAAMGDWILRKGGRSETRLLIVIMAGAAVLGAAMSSTAVVAIFIPIVLRIAAATNLNASRILMPMSYAALISGMLTLIATPPNIVVSEELKAAGFEGLGFFSFAPVGLAVLVVAIVYILLVGRHLMPKAPKEVSNDGGKRSIEEMFEPFQTERKSVFARISRRSPLVGKTIRDSGISDQYSATVLSIVRGKTTMGEEVVAGGSRTALKAGDSLLVEGQPDDLARLVEEQGLRERSATAEEKKRGLWEIGAAVIMIHPDSSLSGKSLRDLQFRNRYGLNVVGLRRAGEAFRDFEGERLAASDSLFVIGPWASIRQLRVRNHDFIVVETPAEEERIVPSYRKMPVSLAILGVMILLSILDVVPMVATVIMAAMAAVATRCLTMEDSYRAIHWSSIVLVAGMLPLADALNSTGGTSMVVDGLMGAVGDSSPRLMLTAIFFLTAALSLFLSNTASAVLVAPIAISAAATLGVSPYPFAVAVLIAASAAFTTPISTPVVTLVVDPGRYRFLDFVKVGVPLLGLTYLVVFLIVPLVFPF